MLSTRPRRNAKRLASDEWKRNSGKILSLRDIVKHGPRTHPQFATHKPDTRKDGFCARTHTHTHTCARHRIARVRVNHVCGLCPPSGESHFAFRRASFFRQAPASAPTWLSTISWATLSEGCVRGCLSRVHKLHISRCTIWRDA